MAHNPYDHTGAGTINQANRRFWKRDQSRPYKTAHRDNGAALHDPHGIGAINARFWGRDDALLNESIRESGGDVPDEEDDDEDDPTGYPEDETGAEVGGPPRAEDRKRGRTGDRRMIRVRVHDEAFKISA